jgi:hypothetical protein
LEDKKLKILNENIFSVKGKNNAHFGWGAKEHFYDRPEESKK